MTEQTEGARLHDRVTRGENLTDAERAALEQWYRDGDEAEAALLAAHRTVASQDSDEDRAWWLMTAWFTFQKAAEGDSLAQQHLQRLTSPRSAHADYLRQFIHLCTNAREQAESLAQVAAETIRRSGT
jgi:hypothetical protein